MRIEKGKEKKDSNMKVKCYYTYQHLMIQKIWAPSLTVQLLNNQSQESTHIQDLWDFVSHQIVIATIANFPVILRATIDVRRIGI